MTTLSNSRTGSAAAGASTKENPRLPYATGLAGFAHLVRASSRRIMIMRFRPANISLINRRHYLPRLLLILSSKRQIQKPHQRFEDVDRVTPYQGRIARHTISRKEHFLASVLRILHRFTFHEPRR
jgi:hypothetical protein